jgi:hypothetical protein
MNRITAAAGPAGTMLHGMGLDVVLPLVAYYGLTLAGADTWVALLASTVVSGVRTVWVLLRERRFNPFSTLMLAVFGVGLLLAFVTGDPRLIILKDSAITGVIGLAFLLSLVRGRPLTLEAQRAWAPVEEKKAIDAKWDTNPAAREGYRRTSLVWGLAMLGEASLRAILVFLVPVSIMVGLSTAMWIATVVLLVLWTKRYAKSRQQRATAAPVAAQEV